MERRSNQILGEITEELVGGGKQIRFRAGGSSMSPFIRDGDTVVLGTVKEGLKVGDVVLVRLSSADQERLLLHRIMRLLPGGVITRGDALGEDDGYTPLEEVLGKVVSVTGRGFNFHLRRPFSYLIARRLIFSPRLLRNAVLAKTAKRLTTLLR